MNTDSERFGPYRLLSLLGRGGMGEVWRAFDTESRRDAITRNLTVGPSPFAVATAPDSHHAYVSTATGLWQIDIP